MTSYFTQHLRQTLKGIRQRLSPNYQRRASDKICNQIKQVKAYRHAKHIGIYHAVRGEVDLTPIWHSAPLQGKSCYFPVLTPEKTLIFLPTTQITPFHPNQFGIPEPEVSLSEKIAIDQLDILFLPLVAFDRQGSRIGMGGGYYDRTLANKKPKLLIGLAYDFQRQTYIHREPWDIPLDAIITPTHLYWSHKQ